MTTHKQTEKELKRPDSFQDIGLKFINYSSKNKSRIALMLSPLLIVALLGYGFYMWQHRQSGQRRAALAKILSQYTEEQTGVAKQSEVFQKQIEELKSSKNAAADKKPTAESLLKIAELENKIKDIKPDHSNSNAAYKDFYNANKSNAEGWMAGLSWSSSMLEENKLADAKPVVEEIVKASTSNKFFQIQSRYMLAGILEDLGEFDNALKEADVLAGLVDDESKAMMLLLKGEILYFKNDKNAARPILSEIIEKHGSTREAQTARTLLAEIGPA